MNTHIKREKLKPLCKVTHSVWRSKQSFRLIQKDLDGFSDAWFVLDQLTHGECIVDRSAQVCMIRLVNRGEQGRQSLAFADGLLDWIESRLKTPNQNNTGEPLMEVSYLDETFVQSINCLQRLGICERQSIRPKPDDVSMLTVQFEVSDIWPSSIDV